MALVPTSSSLSNGSQLPTMKPNRRTEASTTTTASPTTSGTTTKFLSSTSLSLSVLLLSTFVAEILGSGLQSGPSSGPFYAGGMYLDKEDQKLYMTGIHYSDEIVASTASKLFAGNDPATTMPSCFLASMRLEENPESSGYIFDGIGDWTSRVTSKNRYDAESCTALAVHQPSQIVVLGTKEDPSLNTPPLAGNIAVYDRNQVNGDQLTEATLISQDDKMNQLIYPVAIAPDSRFSDYMYVVVLASSDAFDNTASYTSATEPYPDWLKHQKYGSSFDMHVSKIQISQGTGRNSGFDGIPTGSITASKAWTTEFPLDPSSQMSPPRVFVGGILHKTTADNKDLVIVVGSTRGTGTGYGEAEGSDEDGFVTVLDPETGEMLGSGAREGSPKDDIVTGVCDDPNDPGHFFIVGGTLGRMGRLQNDEDKVRLPTEMLSPFLRQVQVDRSNFNDDSNLWTLQWAVTKGSSNRAAYGSAIACAVDGDYIYVAGTVDDGAAVVQGDSPRTSQGGDDVWIAKVYKGTQGVEWITQLGSEGNDRLARYGGLTIDKAGNPILYGDTNGSLYRQRGNDEESGMGDMFVMAIDGSTGEVITNEDLVSQKPYFGGSSSQQVLSMDDDIVQDDIVQDDLVQDDLVQDDLVQDDLVQDDQFSENEMTDDGGVDDGVMDDDDDADDDFFDDDTFDKDTPDDSTDSTPTPTMVPTYYTDWPTNDENRGINKEPTGVPTYFTDFPTNDENRGINLVGDDEWNYYDGDENPHFYRPIGLQIAGPSYAGGIAYDSQRNAVLLSGSTYMDAEMEMNENSLCLTGVVDLETGNLDVRTPRGDPDSEEACNAVAFDTNRNAVYALGLAESGNGGEFVGGGSSWDMGLSGDKAYGNIFQMNHDVQLLGGNHVVGYPVLHPVSIVADPLDNKAVFVASMASEEANGNDDYTNAYFPNFLSREKQKYGSNFFLVIHRFMVTEVPGQSENDDVPNTLSQTWEAVFAPDNNGLLVGGMTMVGNGHVLVVVGSTRGSGGPFERVGEGRTDMDGFIMKIDPTTGDLAERSSGSKSSTRLDSINKKDDWILNVCNDRFNHDAFYVVGKSTGKIRDVTDGEQPPEGSSHAFVAKVEVKSLGALWLKHFVMKGDGVMEAGAYACTVTPDSNGENIVYVGGTIKNGATLQGLSESAAPFGKDDMFVAAMNGSTGETKWIQQVGTPEDDRLATTQALDVDSFGNVVVYGETYGDFYDAHEGPEGSADLVIFTMNKKDGSFLAPRSEGKGVGGDTAEEIAENVDNIPEESSQPSGIVATQTNLDSIPSYAGGMYYDKFSNAVYLTGGTYTSDGKNLSKTSHCIFAIATLPQFQWKQNISPGTERAPEACSSLTLANYQGKSEAIVVGSSEPSGLMTELRSNRSGKQYGMVMDFVNQDGNYGLVGGTTIDEENVQYPVKVLSDNDKVFVVSMASKIQEVRPEADRADGRKYPNFTTGGITKYGSHYEILLERHTINHDEDMAPGSMQTTMDMNWRKPLETADQKSIFLSGMTIINSGQNLVVVGSTQSDDEGFDGIMAKVSTQTGDLVEEGENGERGVAYFASMNGSDDWLLNICTDPDDDRYFYVTGATGGTMDGSVSRDDADLTVHAVVAKINGSTLNIEWTTQFAVTHADGGTDRQAASVATGCAVAAGWGHIYVVGDVENGAVLEGAIESSGGDDIFVAMLETGNGNKIWSEQAGSSGDDRVARGGGIAVDENGNAVVYGDTTGSFHRKRGRSSSHTSDLFLMTFNHDNGAHQASLSKQSTDKTNNYNNSVKTGKAPAEWFGEQVKMNSKTLGIVIGFAVLATLLTFCGCFFRRRSRKRAYNVKKNSIFTYLQRFNVEDVDLRKSPAGGWHGTYLNKLASGVNTNAALIHAPFRDEELDDEDKSLFDSAKSIGSNAKKGSLFHSSSAAGFGGYRDKKDSLKSSEIKADKFSIV